MRITKVIIELSHTLIDSSDYTLRQPQSHRFDLRNNRCRSESEATGGGAKIGSSGKKCGEKESKQIRALAYETETQAGALTEHHHAPATEEAYWDDAKKIGASEQSAARN